MVARKCSPLMEPPQQQQAGAAWTHQAVRRALNERSLLIREVERTGLKRLVFACAVYLGACGPGGRGGAAIARGVAATAADTRRAIIHCRCRPRDNG